MSITYLPVRQGTSDIPTPTLLFCYWHFYSLKTLNTLNNKKSQIKKKKLFNKTNKKRLRKKIKRAFLHTLKYSILLFLICVV